MAALGARHQFGLDSDSLPQKTIPEIDISPQNPEFLFELVKLCDGRDDAILDRELAAVQLYLLESSSVSRMLFLTATREPTKQNMDSVANS